MHIEISTANRKDLIQILHLQKECFTIEAELHNTYDIPPLLQDLNSLENEFKSNTYLKAVLDGELVGSVRGFTDDETCYIGRLIVSQKHQNKGIGQLLMKSIETTFNDCNRFELFTGFKSQKNLFLYGKLGYHEFKRIKLSDKLTLVYMEKRLT